MEEALIPVEIKALVPASGVCMIFLGNNQRMFVIHIDPSLGQVLDCYMRGVPRSRPFTHDLMNAALLATGAKLKRAVINDVKDKTFFARLYLEAENEVREKLLVELDARPSDSIALSVLNRTPIFATREVWENVEDAAPILRSLKEMKQPESDDEIFRFDDANEDDDDSDNDSPPF